MKKHRNWRALGVVLGAIAVLASLLGLTGALSTASADPPQGKQTLCHATGSAKNPYVQITISNSGVLAGHEGHTGDVILPPGGNCSDKCPNIAGTQVLVPAGKVVDASGNCVDPPPTDVCPNLPGDQPTVPPGYVQDANGNCTPIPQPCNTATVSGGQGITVTNHELGVAGPTSFQFDYDTVIQPDQITIRYEGNVIFDVGPVGTGGLVTTTVNVPAGTSTQIEITVNGVEAGTVWSYVVHCPGT